MQYMKSDNFHYLFPSIIFGDWLVSGGGGTGGGEGACSVEGFEWLHGMMLVAWFDSVTLRKCSGLFCCPSSFVTGKQMSPGADVQYVCVRSNNNGFTDTESCCGCLNKRNVEYLLLHLGEHMWLWYSELPEETINNLPLTAIDCKLTICD